MDKDKRKEIYDYIRPGRAPYIIGAVWVIFYILGLIAGAQPVGLFVICLFFVAICCGPTGYKEFQISKSLNGEEQYQHFEELYADFSSAQVLGKNDVHIGKQYIFGRRSGGYYKIGNIRKVYQYVHKTNFIEDKRNLRAELISGETVDLFSLPLKGEGNGTLLMAVKLIVAVNPEVKVGYK